VVGYLNTKVGNLVISRLMDPCGGVTANKYGKSLRNSCTLINLRPVRVIPREKIRIYDIYIYLAAENITEET
jgi:hypothetical protein